MAVDIVLVMLADARFVDDWPFLTTEEAADATRVGGVGGGGGANL